MEQALGQQILGLVWYFTLNWCFLLVIAWGIWSYYDAYLRVKSTDSVDLMDRYVKLMMWRRYK